MDTRPNAEGTAPDQTQAHTGDDGHLAREVAAVIQQVSTPSREQPLFFSARQSVTVQDVIGGNSIKPPSELEAETRVLKAVDGIDLNDGEPPEDEDTIRLFREMAAKDIAARASSVIFRASTINHEMEPLTSAHTNEGNNDNKKKTHRRGQSVEQRLFGLTTVLAEMKQSTAKRGTSILFRDSSDPLTQTANVLVEHARDEIAATRKEDKDIEAQKEEEEAIPDTQKRRQVKGQQSHHLSYLGSDVREEMESQFQVFNVFLGERKARTIKYLRRLFLFCMLPSLGVAALLFYVFDNPMPPDLDPEGNFEYASVSWWLLFLGVRQPITLTLALATQTLIIDFLILRTRTLMKWIGPLGTLFFVQGRGYPFVAVCWGCWNFALLWRSRLSSHWLFWQDEIGLFNRENPSGNVTNTYANTLIIVLLIIVGTMVAVKRVFVSLFLGRQAFGHFSEQLAELMHDMVLIGFVATLARTIEKESKSGMEQPLPPPSRGDKQLQDLVATEASAHDEMENEQNLTNDQPNAVDAAKTFIQNHTTIANSSATNGGDSKADFTQSEHNKMTELLDSWEDGDAVEEKTEKRISIGSVLQFRQAATMLNAKYPFTPAFGIADTREACVESAQRVYDRLLLRTPGEDILSFETLALVAKDKDDDLDEEIAKALIKIFRPDRDGNLQLLDFVKSVDNVYKSCRLLSANIRNAKYTDAAVESIVNFCFWFAIGIFVLSELGLDPWAILLSLSSLIISLSFALGTTASKYFDGMLFVLLQRPYGVGDRVHFSDPNVETSIDGSSGWIVEKLSLTTTSVYWGATNERATISNGALSRFRVINSARSPNAQIYVNMKFAVDTPYEKLETFRAAVEQFLKDRPREWLAFNGFRPTEVATALGYVNYMTIAQHRSSWQDIGAILGSKADLMRFNMEVSKQLGMRYISPPLPVDLTIQGSRGTAGEISPQGIAGLAES